PFHLDSNLFHPHVIAALESFEG
ncbi:uncharacterized protein METZ01_LOCUS332852, partial [marine metagenome]